ncbi:MAG: hypothetical protein IV090_20195 [Candidatus Sericytochromatia bacterium]|nr:hypothetical protein [Candidatus Sericytochromatia bacterium]
MKKWIPLVLLLIACSTNNQPSQTQAPSVGAGVLVQVLSPICSKTLQEQKVIPDAARNLGVNEAAVCECGLRKVETKVAANPARVLVIINSSDAQISFLKEVGAECAGELAQKAVAGVFNPGASPTPFPNNPSGM